MRRIPSLPLHKFQIQPIKSAHFFLDDSIDSYAWLHTRFSFFGVGEHGRILTSKCIHVYLCISKGGRSICVGVCASVARV